MDENNKKEKVHKSCKNNSCTTLKSVFSPNVNYKPVKKNQTY